jgi:hypothetical protein
LFGVYKAVGSISSTASEEKQVTVVGEDVEKE